MTGGRNLLREMTAAVLCGTLLLSGGAFAAQPGPLPADVPENAWYAPYVRLCLEEGLMGVLEDGKFHPDQELSLADLLILTAQLWSKTGGREEKQWKTEPDEIWISGDTPPTQEAGLDFTYTDAVAYVSARDNGYMAQIRPRLEESGKSAAETPAVREDLCILLGGNMSSPVYCRGTSMEVDETLGHGARTLYYTGVMEGTGAGFELERPLPRREAAAFLARYAHPEWRIPEERLTGKSQEELSLIYLTFSSFGRAYLEYKLDLVSGELWSYEMTEDNMESRDPDLENEGYRLRGELDRGVVEEFKGSDGVRSTLSWGPRYEAAYFLDGLHWQLTLVFSDESEWEVHGSNAFPPGWEEFWNGFCALAGIEG